jgi:hypothetical protein
MTMPVLTFAVLALARPGVTPAPPDAAPRLGALVRAIRAADYRGDRVELRRLSAALDDVEDPRLRAYRRYWQGFAKWRRALNGFNETPTPPDLEDDLEGAILSFRAALVDQPDWIEAKIGIVGCSANLLFLSSEDQARRQRILADYLPLFREMAGKGAENPRALWLIGGSQLGAPPPYGGDAAKAVATFERGLAAARREALENARLPAHVPSWGGAENLMSLAYLYSHSTLDNRALALAYAEGALVAVPHWRYVADVLVPQIRDLGKTIR